MMKVESPLLHQVIFRYALQDDLPTLEWEGEYTHFRRIFADAFQLSEQGRAILWVAELAGLGLIGQLFSQINSDAASQSNGRKRAYIYGFRIRPAYRGLGIGSRMLRYAEADLRKRGYRRISLNVSRENHAARRLYERFGYRVLSAEPGIWSYVDENGIRQQVNEPAWRMEKDLR